MTKINSKEELPHGTPYFPFQALSQEDNYGQYFTPYHWHDEVEFLYITEGSLILRTEHETYPLHTGHVYFINPGTVHALFGSSRRSHHFALVFPLELLSFSRYDVCQNTYLEPLLSGKLRFPIGTELTPECTCQIGTLICRAARLYLEPPAFQPNPLSIKILLLQILEILFSHRSFLSREHVFSRPSPDHYPLKPVFAYIEAHYTEKITLEQLAGVIHMNRNYFCKYFKEKTGKTPFSYLNEFRINQASSMLLQSELSITEVAINSGFDNMSYFIRQFKHYKGCTPSSFRRVQKTENSDRSTSPPDSFYH